MLGNIGRMEKKMETTKILVSYCGYNGVKWGYIGVIWG